MTWTFGCNITSNSPAVDPHSGEAWRIARCDTWIAAGSQGYDASQPATIDDHRNVIERLRMIKVGGFLDMVLFSPNLLGWLIGFIYFGWVSHQADVFFSPSDVRGEHRGEQRIPGRSHNHGLVGG